MTDRKKRPGTTTYLLRDIPKATMKQARVVLDAKGKTLKRALLDAIAKIAAAA